MRFSLAPAMQVPAGGSRRFDIEGFLAECEAAESAGFHAAYIGEKHDGDTSYSTSPTLLATLALARTTRLVFGTSVIILPIHHPVTVAEDASVLGAMFPGRFRLAVGAGYFKGDFEPFGIDLAERLPRMDQGMEVINAFRRGEQHELAGPWFGRVSRRDEALGPDTTEVFIGAWSKAGVRRAAKYADGWMTDPIRTVSFVRDLADLYRSECARYGKKPRILLFREAWIDDTDESARRVHGPHVLGYHQLYLRRGNVYGEKWEPWLREVKRPEDMRLDHILPDRILCGSADTWIRQLREWQELLQPEELIFRLRHFKGPDLATTLQAVRRIARDVMPAFQATVPVRASAPVR